RPKAAPPTSPSTFLTTSAQPPSREYAQIEPALSALPVRPRAAFLPRRFSFSALRLRSLSHLPRPALFEWPSIVRAGNIDAGTYPSIPWFDRRFSCSAPAI